MMRKMLAWILLLALVAGLTAPVYAAEEESGPAPVTLNVFSNKLGETEIEGLYQDNVFYISPWTVCALTGGYIESHSAEEVVFHFHEGYRVITVTADSNLNEHYNKHNFNADIPTVVYDGEVWISAAEMLRYVGATVTFATDETQDFHMMVSMPYTVLDLCADYAYASDYTAFSWAEAESALVNLEDLLGLAALDTILFGYDPNILNYVNPWYAESVETQIYTDLLLELLRTEGTELSDEESLEVSTFGVASGTVSLSSNFIQECMEWIPEEEFGKALNGSMGISLTAGGVVLDTASAYLSTLETARQFANLAESQKTLLDNTLNRVSKSDPLYQSIPPMFQAAQEASLSMNDEYDANGAAAWKSLADLVRESGEAMMAYSNPVSGACEILNGIVNLSPLTAGLVDVEKKLVFASVSSDVRVIADSLYTADRSDMYRNSYYLTSEDTTKQEHLKADITLALKATLTSRVLLMDTGWLTEEAQADVHQLAVLTVKLLNKAQNARPVPLGVMEYREEDLTWIANLVKNGAMGEALRLNGKAYYWNYGTNQLMCRDAEGNEKVVYQHDTTGEFAVAGSRIFFNQAGNLCSVNLAGGSYTEWGAGTLEAVSDSGRYLICSKDYTLYSLDTWEGTWTELVANAKFLAFHQGVIYYSPTDSDIDYETAQKGKVVFCAVDMDGSNDRVLCTTAPDLYTHVTGFSPASVQQVRFSSDAVYFSYGSIAGTGYFFQGGKIMRVGFDGSEAQVVAGQEELVDADFVVNKDGTITTSEDSYYMDYGQGLKFILDDNVIYWFEPLTGQRVQVAGEEEFDAGIAHDTWEVAFANVSGGYGFYRILYKVHDPNNTGGWRTEYKVIGSAMFMKNLGTGEITILYQSQ